MTNTEEWVQPLRDFLLSRNRNGWITYGPMDLYVRNTYQYICGRSVRTLDLANMSISKEELRGKGTFKKLVQDIEVLLLDEKVRQGIEGIYVENVLIPQFEAGLKRMGFEVVNSRDYPRSYFSPLPLLFGRLAK